jgi:threonine dehydratase
MTMPIVEIHNGVLVVRDDLFEGGTKARFIPLLFAGTDEVVYASPAEGGAQTALATVAAQLGKRATIFVAQRAHLHPRTLMAKRLGAQIVLVSPGYLNVVQARAREYCQEHGARLAPFGFDVPGAVQAIAQAALSIGEEPDEVWCAAGSGVLARGLAQAWPNARRRVVQVGRALSAKRNDSQISQAVRMGD